MQVRAKFTVNKVAQFGGYNGKPAMCYKDGVETDVPQREITMYPVTCGSKEDVSFAEATPSGTLTFTLNNSDLKDEFQPGSAYYLTFDKVE